MKDDNVEKTEFENENYTIKEEWIEPGISCSHLCHDCPKGSWCFDSLCKNTSNE